MYGLKRHWHDGTAAVSFDLLTFIERLTALVPPPRTHRLTCHGVLAPASAWRDLVVPKRTKAPAAPSRAAFAPVSSSAPSTSARSHSRRYTRAELQRPSLCRRRPHLPALRRFARAEAPRRAEPG